MIEKMEDGVSKSDSSGNVQPSHSMDSFLDNLLITSQTCSHTHTCNPPGPDASHTHTCHHTHTRVDPPEKPLGNREAVRKYREKKKAHAAYLEEEVKKLRLVNHQLMKKMQRQAVLEAEILRLRGVLVDIRGKLNVELDAFPEQKRRYSVNSFEESNGGGKSISVNNIPCSSTRPISIDGCGNMMANLESNCQPPIVDCRANTNGVEIAEKTTAGFDGNVDAICSSRRVK